MWDLIGPLAFGLRIFTFHGLALALLGRTLTEEKVLKNSDSKNNQIRLDCAKF